MEHVGGLMFFCKLPNNMVIDHVQSQTNYFKVAWLSVVTYLEDQGSILSKISGNPDGLPR